MKTTSKLTPWFTKGEKPIHIGVYNVSCQRENQSGKYYSYWNGKNFKSFSLSVDMAYMAYLEDCADYIGLLETGSWRGLAENPEV